MQGGEGQVPQADEHCYGVGGTGLLLGMLLGEQLLLVMMMMRAHPSSSIMGIMRSALQTTTGTWVGGIGRLIRGPGWVRWISGEPPLTIVLIVCTITRSVRCNIYRPVITSSLICRLTHSLVVSRTIHTMGTPDISLLVMTTASALLPSDVFMIMS
jgi:hypothetical protein